MGNEGFPNDQTGSIYLFEQLVMFFGLGETIRHSEDYDVSLSEYF